MKLMEIRLLKTFVTVARLRGFTAAAKVLHTVQPAVSRQISDLEDELGVSLFRRSTREVSITAAGELLLREAEQILAHERRARQMVQRAGKGQIGRLRIGFLGSACQSFLPRLVQGYSAQYPDVQIELSEMPAAEQIRALGEGQLEISLARVLPTTAPEGIASVNVYTDRLMVFVPRSHALASRRVVSIAELADSPFVLYKRSGSLVLFDQIISVCQSAGVSPQIVQQANTMQTVLTSVAACLGVAVAPGCIRKLDMQGCCSLRLRERTAAIPFQMHYRQEQAEPSTLAFVQQFRQARQRIREEMRL